MCYFSKMNHCIKISLLTLLVFVTSTLLAQHVFTKDGVDLGPRSEMIALCQDQTLGQEMAMDGETVDFSATCVCMMDEMIPRITIEELNEAIENDSFNDLMFREDLSPHIEECIFANLDDLSGMEISSETIGESSPGRQLFIDECIDEVIAQSESVISFDQAEDYCLCVVDRMLEKGYSFSAIIDVINESSTVFNEVVIPCLDELNISETSSAKPVEVWFRGGATHVDLFPAFGQYKVKITFGDNDRYFFLDTGASHVMMDRTFADILMQEGLLADQNWQQQMEFLFADGSSDWLDIYSVPKIRIGNYLIENLEIAVGDDVEFLCGMNLLNAFSDWSINPKSNKILIVQE